PRLGAVKGLAHCFVEALFGGALPDRFQPYRTRIENAALPFYKSSQRLLTISSTLRTLCTMWKRAWSVLSQTRSGPKLLENVPTIALGSVEKLDQSQESESTRCYSRR